MHDRGLAAGPLWLPSATGVQIRAAYVLGCVKTAFREGVGFAGTNVVQRRSLNSGYGTEERDGAWVRGPGLSGTEDVRDGGPTMP
jgi:hypothetical protein